MRHIIAKLLWIIILGGFSAFYSCGMQEQLETNHVTEGEYLVNIINSDRNRYADDTYYFYEGIVNLRRYFLEDGSIDYYTNEKGYWLVDYAVWDRDIYYVRSNGVGFELWKQDSRTDEKIMLLSQKDIETLNGGEKLNPGTAFSHEDYCRIDAYEKYLYFMISGEHEFISPIEGDFMQEYIDISTLFPEDDMSEEIQKVIYDEITIERYYNSNYERYDQIGIRDESGHKILYSYVDMGILVNEKNVRFGKEAGEHQYCIDGDEESHPIACLRGKKFKWSKIEEKNLTVENGKIIGWLSVSRDPNVLFDLNQNFIIREVLFELDIETGESRILYDTVNNLEKIIGYQDGVVYFAGNDTVYSRELDSDQEKVLFDLPGGEDYMIDWQAGYLIIQNEKDIDDVIAYQVSEDRLVGEEK